MIKRVGEAGKVFFRSERFFHTDNGWFFQTRENSIEGPFISHKEAENELVLYIRKINSSFVH